MKKKSVKKLFIFSKEIIMDEGFPLRVRLSLRKGLQSETIVLLWYYCLKMVPSKIYDPCLFYFSEVTGVTLQLKLHLCLYSAVILKTSVPKISKGNTTKGKGQLFLSGSSNLGNTMKINTTTHCWINSNIFLLHVSAYSDQVQKSNR